MKLVAVLFLCLTLFEFEQMLQEEDPVEPEHFSWELGTPENIPSTEVIIDPYIIQEIDEWKKSGDYQY